MSDLYVRRFDRQDPRLGRQRVQDSASRAFPMMAVVDTTQWRTKTIRLWDPVPNPNQRIGNCTGCDSAMNFNAAGNRRLGRVLDMTDADRIYSLATTLDPWEGSWTAPDWTDTGSSGLAAAKAAKQLGLGGEYRWALSGGADAVIQQVMEGRTVGNGTDWTYPMFSTDKREPHTGLPIIEPTGQLAGGHQWRTHGYIEHLDMTVNRCWWGPEFRDFLLKREHHNDLLLGRQGDAYTQVTA